ncbi:MAG: hypothetical protein ACK553_07340 [Planctomycetota bacterium]|jgi:hypothetical protein
MDFLHRQASGLKMCLNHSQAGIEESILELERDFRAWMEHPSQRMVRNKLLEHLVNFRWILDQHYTRIAGEGYLENVAAMKPGMYGQLREIECRQCLVIDDLDDLVRRARGCDSDRDTIALLLDDFQRLHGEILEEETLERSMVEKGFA